MNYDDLGEGGVGGNDTIVGERSMGGDWEVLPMYAWTVGNGGDGSSDYCTICWGYNVLYF
jgi:hypothetical protein